MKVLQIQAQDSFFKSLKRLKWHAHPVYRFYSFFRYRLPGFIKNVWSFRRELWDHRWWDYSFTLRILKRSLEIQEQGMSAKGIEESVSLDKKLSKMRRAIELLNNKIDDNFIKRTEEIYGDAYLGELVFEETENGKYTLVDEETEEQKQHNKLIFKKAHELEQKEWKELWQIIEGKKYKQYKDWDGSDLRGWWD
jgi:hypothetical protein